MVGGLGVEGDEGGARVGEVAHDAVHGGHLWGLGWAVDEIMSGGGWVGGW